MNKRVALITGAAKGIGFAVAQELFSQGYGIAILDIDDSAGKDAALAIDSTTKDVKSFACDVSKVESIEAAISAVGEYFGRIDVVINNAGILSSSSILTTTPEEWKRVLDINLTGCFFIIQKSIPYLKKVDAPRIINISSLAGRMGGFETGMAYSATKGALLSITMGMARQLAPDGITVNAICPSTTSSDMIDGFTPEARERLLGRVPLGRFATVEDIANAVAFIASEKSGYITGVSLDVNGGTYMS